MAIFQIQSKFKNDYKITQLIVCESFYQYCLTSLVKALMQKLRDFCLKK